MTITEESRLELYQGLCETLGPLRAGTLMELLPSVGWADVATKHDLDQTRIATKSDLDLMGSELRAETANLGAELRAETANLAAELRAETANLRAEITALRSELRSEVAELRGAIESLRSDFFREQRNQMFALISANTAITALLLTAFKIF